MSIDWRRGADWLPELTALALLLFWSVYWFGAPDLHRFVRDVSADDSFYYLQIAHQTSLGNFSTFDGVNPTNGYHPLWMFMLVPIFWLTPDKIEAIYWAKALEFALIAAASLVLIRSGKRLGCRGPLLVLVPLILWSCSWLYLGMESSPYILLLAMLLHGLTRSVEGGRTGVLYATLFLLPWVRLESAAISITLASLLLFPGLDASTTWRRRLEPMLASIAGLLAYFVYNHGLFDIAVPVSGSIKSAWAAQRWLDAGGFDLRSSVVGVLGDFWNPRTLLLGLLTAAICVPAIWENRFTARSEGREARARLLLGYFMLAVAAGALARVAFSIFLSHPEFSHYGWYFVPTALLGAMIVPALDRLKPVAIVIRALPSNALGRQATTIQWAVVALLALLLSRHALISTRMKLDQWQTHEAQGTVDWEIASLEGTRWMNAHLPADSIIGIEDAGVVGYFSDHRVHNLDGLVNSTDFYRSELRGQRGAWIDEARIDHFAVVGSHSLEDGCRLAGATRDAQCEREHETRPFESKGRVLAFSVWQHRNAPR